jgi:hypothetical protein
MARVGEGDTFWDQVDSGNGVGCIGVSPELKGNQPRNCKLRTGPRRSRRPPPQAIKPPTFGQGYGRTYNQEPQLHVGEPHPGWSASVGPPV